MILFQKFEIISTLKNSILLVLEQSYIQWLPVG